METLLQRQTHHQYLYNALADEYKKRAMNTLVHDQLIEKAQTLKSVVSGNQALEIGVGGWQMNKCLHDVGFETSGIDIADQMIENAKCLNPSGHFFVGDYLKTSMNKQYDLVAALAFIHLFEQDEAHEILLKIYHDLAQNGVLHLTTTKEDHYEYAKIAKGDYGDSYLRYRARHTPESFIWLLDGTGFVFEHIATEDGVDGKQWMSMIARKK